jgi:hypothetical protein
MSKGNRGNIRIETESSVLDTHFGGETHFHLRCHTVVAKSVINKSQSKNSTPATPRLCKHNRKHAFYANCNSGSHTDVATSWYLYCGRGKVGDLQTELYWRIYSSKIWPFGGF